MIPVLVRSLIASVAGIGSAAAVSGPASRVVLDQVVGEGYSHSTAPFATNEETKRDWVEAVVHNGGMGDDYRLETFRVKVPDLSYDTRTQEVLYDNQGSGGTTTDSNTRPTSISSWNWRSFRSRSGVAARPSTAAQCRCR